VPAQEQQDHARSSHAQQKGHNAYAAGHHGSAAATHGMSSYELAAEKMTDREILGTLALHLWPKGKISSCPPTAAHASALVCVCWWGRGLAMSPVFLAERTVPAGSCFSSTAHVSAC
jgi:hypothetical protein